MRRFVAGLLALGFALSLANAETVPVDMRRVWCAHGFDAGRFETFRLEKLKEPNGLSADVWTAVERQIIRGLEAKGYRHEPNAGQLQVSFGAFPPNDVSHPAVGLYLKLRTGTRLLDLTKWSVGAMADAPYEKGTMIALAERLVSEIPARSKP